MICIYAIYNDITNLYYIGSTTNYSKRKTTHFNKLRKGIHSNKSLQKDFNIYGEEHFSFTVLKELKSDENLKFEEEYFISKYEGQLYNVYKHCNFLDSSSRSSVSEKCSGSKNGNYHRKHTPEEIKRCRDNRYGVGYVCKPKHSNYVRKTEEEKLESRKRQAEYMRNRIVSDETRKKLSEYRKGKKHSKETIEKLRQQRKGENNANCKLSKDEVIYIHNCLVSGSKTIKEVCDEFNIGVTQAYKIRRKEHWVFNG